MTINAEDCGDVRPPMNELRNAHAQAAAQQGSPADANAQQQTAATQDTQPENAFLRGRTLVNASVDGVHARIDGYAEQSASASRHRIQQHLSKGSNFRILGLCVVLLLGLISIRMYDGRHPGPTRVLCEGIRWVVIFPRLEIACKEYEHELDNTLVSSIMETRKIAVNRVVRPLHKVVTEKVKLGWQTVARPRQVHVADEITLHMQEESRAVETFASDRVSYGAWSVVRKWREIEEVPK